MNALKKWGKKYSKQFIIILFAVGAIVLLLQSKNAGENEEKGTAESVEFEKGYNLPVDETEAEEAKKEGGQMMQEIREIYGAYAGENSGNVTISEEVVKQILTTMEKTKFPVLYDGGYESIHNYEKVDVFLKNAGKGKQGEVIVYEVHDDGGIGRNKFIFDGEEMYVLYTGFMWNENNKPISYGTTYTRIRDWDYTEKGWFCYEYCVPEPPEVTEVVDGNCMMRVKPMDERFREIALKYLRPIGYQGNNFLCSEWGEGQMENLDYSGLFEYFYAMKYQKKLIAEEYLGGIPKAEFEEVMMEYLAITPEQLQEYAVYDEQTQRYRWNRLGGGNFTPRGFDLSIPEVTGVKENADGTMVITVDAVCETFGNDVVISHEVTVQKQEDGSVKYLSNKILGDGLEMIPAYQFRVTREQVAESQ